MVMLKMDKVRPEGTAVLLSKDGDYSASIVNIEEYTVQGSGNAGWKVTLTILDADEAGKTIIDNFPISGVDTTGKPNFFRLQEFIKSVESTKYTTKEDLDAYMNSLLNQDLDTEKLAAGFIGRQAFPHLESSTFIAKTTGRTSASTRPKFYLTKETYDQHVELKVARTDLHESVQLYLLTKNSGTNGAVSTGVGAATSAVATASDVV